MIHNWINPIYFSTLFSVATLQTLAVMSPGPDFAVVTRNSILYSRKVGVATTLGITAGVLFHMSYLLLGFGLLVSTLVHVFFLIKAAGCLYLGYLGWKCLRSSQSWSNDVSTTNPDLGISARSAFWSGFLTNVLNPKAILFLLSLFTVVIDKNTPIQVLILCGAMIVLITLAWFLIVSLTFSGSLKDYFFRFGLWIDRFTGGFLLLVAAKIGFSFFD